jgi:acyl transferase domain-containing protein
MSPQTEPIAVIGSGCRFPGRANTPSQLWSVLKEAPNTAQPIPIDRFNVDRFYHPDGSHHGTCNVKETYFLNQDIRCFDAGFFAIPPGEAAAMDPQHRLLMETVYEAMEAAGLSLSDLQGSDTAAYVGVMVCLRTLTHAFDLTGYQCSDYYILAAQDFNIVPTYNSTGIGMSSSYRYADSANHSSELKRLGPTLLFL